ncbi:MAG: 16S rRNA (uracil(1498)-N(3))-methyltransferase [Gammaproteobacteria bacterium]|nr:16S rRNA (uracil(1498)-N(3))-methyltransferase [Gammaproteobacteria bacterium]
MRKIRIYTPQSLHVGGIAVLNANAANHVIRVLRLSANAVLHLFNGDGNEYSARITETTKQEVILNVEAAISTPFCNEALSLHLGQVISRGERMDFTLQKAVELGVTAITPLFSEFCNVVLAGDRLEKRMSHWQGVIISACEQSGRTDIPVLHPTQKIDAWMTKTEARYKLTLDPTGSHNLKSLAFEKQSTDQIDFTLLIGSEGGLSDKECRLASEQGFLGIRLGPRILRTETAALATIAALQSLYGDFN